jgi:chemotaxis protein methyltransferase CheR
MDTLDYNFVKREILTLTGLDLNCYKSPQIQRRLKTLLVRSGHTTWGTFFSALQDDPVECGKLRDYLTINVSSFFRDPEKFKDLKENILPGLLRSTPQGVCSRPTLRLWSAGCSRGHEPYSLAILLSEATSPHHRHHILATDIDHSALEWARAGGPYFAEELANVPPILLSRYFRRDGNAYYVTENLRQRVIFLLADPPQGGFDLIVCRNVVIYFTAEAKAQLYQRFYDALSPGGVLFVGGTEIVPKASETGFETVGISFYRRNGVARNRNCGFGTGSNLRFDNQKR